MMPKHPDGQIKHITWLPILPKAADTGMAQSGIGPSSKPPPDTGPSAILEQAESWT